MRKARVGVSEIEGGGGGGMGAVVILSARAQPTAEMEKEGEGWHWRRSIQTTRPLLRSAVCCPKHWANHAQAFKASSSQNLM